MRCLEVCEGKPARLPTLQKDGEDGPIARFHMLLHLAANDDCSTSLGAPEHPPTARLDHRPPIHFDHQSTVRTILVQCTAPEILPRLQPRCSPARFDERISFVQ